MIHEYLVIIDMTLHKKFFQGAIWNLDAPLCNAAILFFSFRNCGLMRPDPGEFAKLLAQLLYKPDNDVDDDADVVSGLRGSSNSG